jgi:hypothetical protein
VEGVKGGKGWVIACMLLGQCAQMCGCLHVVALQWWYPGKLMRSAASLL